MNHAIKNNQFPSYTNLQKLTRTTMMPQDFGHVVDPKYCHTARTKKKY